MLISMKTDNWTIDFFIYRDWTLHGSGLDFQILHKEQLIDPVPDILDPDISIV